MGCAYHSDDGDFFCSGSGKPYGLTYTIGDTIGCYLNFRNDGEEASTFNSGEKNWQRP